MEKDELTYSVIGCAMKVHNTLGNGFQEIIYQRCLAIELQRAKIKFVQEQEQVIFYEGIEVGLRRVDFVIEKKITVELKAVIDLLDGHLAQAKNYVTAYGFEKGLLINFGSVSLQHKLIFNNNNKYKLPQNKA
jgi:GxxExxY protein